jgi:biopolymer transport protein ExbD
VSSSKKFKPKLEENVQPNLVPMVDIMFLMLLFFMLGADMSQRETEDLILPTADKVQENPKEKAAGEIVTVVNLQHDAAITCPAQRTGLCRELPHYIILIRGQAFTFDSFPAQIKAEAESSLEPDIDPLAGKQLSARKVTIRADRTAPFGLVQSIITICGTNGIYKIEVGAARPPES